MEFCAHSAVSNTINFELKHQPCALDPHVKREVQVIELYALRSRKPSKEAPRHGVQICRQRADIDEVLLVRIGRDFRITCDQVILDNERLARPEIARIVEGYGLIFVDLFSLHIND